MEWINEWNGLMNGMDYWKEWINDLDGLMNGTD